MKSTRFTQTGREFSLPKLMELLTKFLVDPDENKLLFRAIPKSLCGKNAIKVWCRETTDPYFTVPPTMQQSAGARNRIAGATRSIPGTRRLKSCKSKKWCWFTFEEICKELGVLAEELLVSWGVTETAGAELAAAVAALLTPEAGATVNVGTYVLNGTNNIEAGGLLDDAAPGHKGTQISG
jgi:hypothetical protein